MARWPTQVLAWHPSVCIGLPLHNPCHQCSLTPLDCAGPKISREQMRDGKVPLGFRDNCAHLLIPLNECVRTHACQRRKQSAGGAVVSAAAAPRMAAASSGHSPAYLRSALTTACYVVNPAGHAAGAGTRRVSCHGAARTSATHTKHASITSMSDASLFTGPRRQGLFESGEAVRWRLRPGWLALGRR